MPCPQCEPWSLEEMPPCTVWVFSFFCLFSHCGLGRGVMLNCDESIGVVVEGWSCVWFDGRSAVGLGAVIVARAPGMLALAASDAATTVLTVFRANVPVPFAAPMPLFFAKFPAPPSLVTPSLHPFIT